VSFVRPAALCYPPIYSCDVRALSRSPLTCHPFLRRTCVRTRVVCSSLSLRPPPLPRSPTTPPPLRAYVRACVRAHVYVRASHPLHYCCVRACVRASVGNHLAPPPPSAMRGNGHGDVFAHLRTCTHVRTYTYVDIYVVRAGSTTSLQLPCSLTRTASRCRRPHGQPREPWASRGIRGVKGMATNPPGSFVQSSVVMDPGLVWNLGRQRCSLASGGDPNVRQAT